MSDDLVKRLRDRQVCSPPQNSCRNDWCMDEAADRIEALEAENAKIKEDADLCATEWRAEIAANNIVRGHLRLAWEALKPFAEMAEYFTEDVDGSHIESFDLQLSDLRRARQALKGTTHE